MNERVPDSSGLPLRAMVMVLLFLGVVFLLVGFQAIGSSGDSDDDSTVTSATTTSVVSSTSEVPPPPSEEAKVEVRVFNISSQDGAADRTATQLRDAGWNVVDTGNLSVSEVAGTTVYFTAAEGEQAAAEDIGRQLDVPVEPRGAELADQPPGVIVIVTG